MSAPTPPHESRFVNVSRRAFLARSAALGALVLVPALACSNGDDQAFSNPTTPEGAGTTAPSASSGPALGDGAQLAIAFSYAAVGGGGRVRNPYIAVWVEDAAGELVQTVSLWFENGKGLRWLRDLKRWYSVDQSRVSAGGEAMIDTISSATRPAGAYSLAWDGSTTTGGRAAQGAYFICIEAAREHGPYELIREPITLGTEAFSSALPDNGELTAASVAFSV